jgi:quercetin dioxygenase-like cupin family protein
MPTIIDLNAEAAKHAGGIARLATYRDGLLLLGMSAKAGAGHWEVHPEDELIHILAGRTTLEAVCSEGPPESFALRAGSVAVIPKGTWHRFRSEAVARAVLSAVVPGPHIEGDVDDPRTAEPHKVRAGDPPRIVHLDTEAAKLTMFRKLTPTSTFDERRGSTARLPDYRDGILFLGKSAGTSHWETHPEEELVHVLDGSRTLEIVGDEGPPWSFELRAGTIAIVPKGAWHRVRSAEGGTTFSATLPGDHIDLDVVDPRPYAPGAGKAAAG